MRIDESRQDPEESRGHRNPEWQNQKSYQDSIRNTIYRLKSKYAADIGKGNTYPLIRWSTP